MKVLYTLSCFNGLYDTGASIENNVDMIFPLLWQNFVNRAFVRNSSWDFLFLNTGFSHDLFKHSLPLCDTLNVPSHPIASDVQMTFASASQGDGYDYTVRCDQDMFISESWMKKIDKFLNENPEIDILSPSNLSQPVTPIEYDFIKDNATEPWGSPGLGDCIVFIKQDFFKRAYEEYMTNPFFSHRNTSDPFKGSSYTYGEICDYLEHIPKYKCLDAKPHNCAQIELDFWAAMAKVGMKHAGIVNHDGRSFRIKEKVMQFENLMRFEKFEDGIDEIDHTVPKYKQVEAPFFHLGHSYLTSLHFNSFSHPRFGTQGLVEELYSTFYNDEKFGFWGMFCSVIMIMADITKNKQLIDMIDLNTKKVLDSKGIPHEEFNIFRKRVEDFYGPQFDEYRQE